MYLGFHSLTCFYIEHTSLHINLCTCDSFICTSAHWVHPIKFAIRYLSKTFFPWTYSSAIERFIPRDASLRHKSNESLCYSVKEIFRDDRSVHKRLRLVRHQHHFGACHLDDLNCNSNRPIALPIGNLYLKNISHFFCTALSDFNNVQDYFRRCQLGNVKL